MSNDGDSTQAQPQRVKPQRKLVWRIVRGLGLTLLGLVLVFYGGFLALMTVTENQWLGEAPFHAAFDVESIQPHEFTLIDEGATSLAVRLAMIRDAKASLDLEFFIYELDAASRIVTQALAEKAKSGVKVRVLVDFSLAVFELRPVYAREMADAGVDVRYYNTASVARFFSVQHRTHRKILLADGTSAMVGGRNIADDYFDLSHHYNFLDSDVLVQGPVVTSMQESFDLYWDSAWAVDPQELNLDEVAEAGESPGSLLQVQSADSQVLQKLNSIDLDLPSHTCPKTRFVSDYPGAGLHNRKVYTAITEVLGNAREKVIAESPYFVLREDGVAVVEALTSRGVDVQILTNSLYSTDAFYTVSPLYFSLRELGAAGVELFAYAGAPAKPPSATSELFPGSKRWGVHSKRALVDDDTVLIGTYNIDPRSANLNSELMLVCTGSKSLAQQMRANLEQRLAGAKPVIRAGEVESSHLIGDAPLKSLMLMGLVAPVANLFSFLL